MSNERQVDFKKLLRDRAARLVRILDKRETSVVLTANEIALIYDAGRRLVGQEPIDAKILELRQAVDDCS